MQLPELNLDRQIVKPSGDNTVDSAVVEAAGQTDPTSYQFAGNSAYDVNTNTQNVSGDKVRTGVIESTNYSYTSPNIYSNTGTSIDLNNGIIRGVKFAIDGSGNAFFKGDITGASGVFSGTISADNVTAGTLTGSTVRTSSGTTRVEMVAASNTFITYYNGLMTFAVGGNGGRNIWYSPSGAFAMQIYGWSSPGAIFDTSGSTGVSTSGMFLSGSYLVPTSATMDLGAIGARWNNVIANGADFTGSVNAAQMTFTTAATSGWATDCVPAFNNDKDSGNSSKGWVNIWMSGSGYLYLNRASTTENIYGGTSGRIQLNASTFHWFNIGGNLRAQISNTGLTIHGTNGLYMPNSHTIDHGLVTSTLPATTGTLKNAIVPTDEGFVALNCMESPDVWFMDFCYEKGKLDPLFLKVTVAPYHYIQCADGEYQVWGKRKGFAETRFEKKTGKEYIANERFLNMSKPI